MAIAAAAVVPATAMARVSDVEPSSPWNVDWNQDSCMLRRAFGGESDPVQLQFEQFQPGDGFQLVIIGDTFRHLGQSDRLRIAFGDADPIDLSGRLMVGEASDGSAAVFLSSLSLGSSGNDDVPYTPVTQALEAAITKITLRWGGRTLTVATGPLNRAFAAMRECTNDLVRNWGFDPQEQAGLSRRPTPTDNPGRWLGTFDYPKGALDDGKQAIVNFRLNVDHEGNPTHCRILRSYSGEDFDRRSCQLLLARARFQPALNSRGKPVPSYFVSTIRWVAGL